jgi:hypothetical protein
VAVHHYSTFTRFHQAVDKPQQRGLPGTVGSDDSDPTLGQVQGKIVQQGFGSVGAIDRDMHRNPAETDGVHGVISRFT